MLVVDDEPAVLQLLKMNLEQEGYDAALAADGATALQRVKELKPDLVILDVMMPNLDGWEVLTHLQTLESRPKVVVVTAKSKVEDRQRAMELGADQFITKPFEVEQLLAVVGDLTKTRRRR